jgi:hypothetical protein
MGATTGAGVARGRIDAQMKSSIAARLIGRGSRCDRRMNEIQRMSHPYAGGTDIRPSGCRVLSDGQASRSGKDNQ